MYAINIALAVVAHATMLQVAARRGLLIEPLTARQLRVRAIDSLFAPIVFIASIPVAYLVDVNTAKLCWLVLLIVGPLGAGLIRRADVRFEKQSSIPEVPE